MFIEQGTYDSPTSKVISLDNILKIFKKLDATDIYIKKLAPNDNSKNQPYFGSHLTDLPFIPTTEIVGSNSKSQKDIKRKIKYQASLNFNWLDANGDIYNAPNAKLIYYPQYPEVRFSGFLSGSKVNISEWMAPEKQGRCEGRWLIIGISEDKNIFGYIATPESNLSKELAISNFIEITNIFWKPAYQSGHQPANTREALIQKLGEIHDMGWIPSQKLAKNMVVSPYNALNGGGYTLEAILGIPANGIAEPDYLGWEVKQFGVKKWPVSGARPTTLFTPEPDGGYYRIEGAKEFVKAYGYTDKNGKADRMNFGGKHVVDIPHSTTSLTLQLQGFDQKKSKIIDAAGAIALVDRTGKITASWSFAKLMDHWKRKHAKAVFIPAMKQKTKDGYEYRYGKDIELGIGTDFEKFLAAMTTGNIYYDPGIKLENISSEKPKVKARSQFRTNHKHLSSLYNKFEFIDLKN